MDVVPRDLLGIRQPSQGVSLNMVLQTPEDLMASRRRLLATDVNTTQSLNSDSSIRLSYISNVVSCYAASDCFGEECKHLC